jgi:hypothetical protein
VIGGRACVCELFSVVAPPWRGDRMILSRLVSFVLVSIIAFSCCQAGADGRLKGAFRLPEQNGWILVHLEGAPERLGFQHGYLLAPEIQALQKAIELELTHDTLKDWRFFRETARDLLWPLVDKEYQSELKGWDPKGAPEFVRARKAMQYSRSIDDFARIMTLGNNGGYANNWLVADRRSNEIASLELGLKNVILRRTTDGCFVGANFPVDEKLAREETDFAMQDLGLSANARRVRWEQLTAEYKGRIDLEVGKRFLSDHFDSFEKKDEPNERTLCGQYRPFAPRVASLANRFRSGRRCPGQDRRRRPGRADVLRSGPGAFLRHLLRSRRAPGQTS